MRIDNQTEWNTADLRKLFAHVLHRNRKHEGPFPSKRLRVKVAHNRSVGRVSGRAWLNTGHILMLVPKPEYGPFRGVVTAAVFDHELQHCRGHRHGVGMSPHVTPAELERNAWAEQFTVRPAEAPPPRNRVIELEKKLQRAVVSEKRARRRLKLAETIHKRWVRRVKRYDSLLLKASVQSS